MKITRRRLGIIAFFVVCATAFAALYRPSFSENVLYGTADGQDLLLDVYRPPFTVFRRSRPAILLLHSGSWSSGDKAELSGLSATLAAEGFVCFNVDYRLVGGPRNRYPAALDDAQRAVRWIRANASTYGVDPRFICAVGDSAGGQLSALLGTRDTRDNSDKSLSSYSSRVQAVVDLCGINDLSAYVKSTPKWAMIVTNFLGGWPKDIPAVFREATPISWVSKQSAPFLIVHGGRDKLVPLDQSKRMLSALKREKIPASLRFFPTQGHGIPQGDDFYALVKEMTAFFERSLHE